MNKYILSVDQSTQGTKGLIFAENGMPVARCDRPHRQIVSKRGWVEHDPEEIYRNTIAVVHDVIEKAAVDKEKIVACGISNQRETVVAWDRRTSKPVCNAIVWQCARGAEICRRLDRNGFSEKVKSITGLNLSPYFSAAKLAWIMENVDEAKTLASSGNLCMGTVDSWLIYRLTHGRSFKTDYSNASRTQLFNIISLDWDTEICRAFGVPANCLADVCDSDSIFGETDFEGCFPHSIPIVGVLGDSNCALFGQGCLTKGMIKATYGTGSSVMLNIGEKPLFSKDVVTSLAWVINGKASYVLEGNINYAGAVITWLKDNLNLIDSDSEVKALVKQSNPKDHTYIVPAFTGLGAPYWDSKAAALITGMTRLTGRAEIVRAADDCIAFQVADIVKCMQSQSGVGVRELRADGGPTKDSYLMQFQSDILDLPVSVTKIQEVSGMGAAYMAGIRTGVYDRIKLFEKIRRTGYISKMSSERRSELYSGWKKAVSLSLHH